MIAGLIARKAAPGVAHLPAERWRNPKRVRLILKTNWNKMKTATFGTHS